jgi:hypothetical protein
MPFMHETLEYTIVTFITMITGPSTASTYPHVFTNTGLSHQYETYTATLTDGCAVTEWSDTAEVYYTTFTAFESEAAHLTAAATGPESVPCRGTEEEFKPDEECVARGMDTACIGQCPQNEDGLFICPEEIHDRAIDLKMGLGRVCWQENSTAHALHKPCLKGDHWVGCVPGVGAIDKYVAWMWL